MILYYYFLDFVYLLLIFFIWLCLDTQVNVSKAKLFDKKYWLFYLIISEEKGNAKEEEGEITSEASEKEEIAKGGWRWNTVQEAHSFLTHS